MESTRRSVAKALSWRLLATAITTALVFIITGQGEFAAPTAWSGHDHFLPGAPTGSGVGRDAVCERCRVWYRNMDIVGMK